MKKKILIIAMLVAIIACFLVISASAVEVNGVHYTLDEANGTATVNTENQTAQKTVFEIPSEITVGEKSYKVTKIENKAFANNPTVVEIRILSEYITKIPYGTFLGTSATLEKVYIDFSRITSIDTYGLNVSSERNDRTPTACLDTFRFYDAKAYIADKSEVVITNPDFSNCTVLGDAAFQNCAKFETITIPATCQIYQQTFRNSTVKYFEMFGEKASIPTHFLAGASELLTVKIHSTSITSVGASGITGASKLEEIHIDLSSCTYFDGSSFIFSSRYDGGNTKTAWYDLDGNRRVDLSSAKTLGNQSFASTNLGGSGATEIIWPQGLESISSQVFRRANICGTVYIAAAPGKTLTLQSYTFGGNNGIDLFICKGVTKITSNPFSDSSINTMDFILLDSVNTSEASTMFSSSSNITVYYIGLTDTTKFSNSTLVPITAGTVSYSATCGVTASVTTASETLAFGTATHNYIEGEYDNTVCPINTFKTHTCSKCEETKVVSTVDGLTPKAHNHIVKFNIEYADFTQNGFITYKCEACDSKITEQEATAQAIFEYLGFSLKADKSGSICIGYLINETAASDYLAVNTSFAFGVVGYIPVANENPLVVVDGKASASEPKYTITADITKTGFSAFDFVITGFDGHTDINLVMCAYVCDGESIYYLNIDQATNKVAQSTSATTFSYDGLKAYMDAN